MMLFGASCCLGLPSRQQSRLAAVLQDEPGKFAPRLRILEKVAQIASLSHVVCLKPRSPSMLCFFEAVFRMASCKSF